MKFTQKEASAKSQKCGVEMVGTYNGANKKVAHKCVFCGEIFYPIAWDVWNQGVKRCKKCMYIGRRTNTNKWFGTKDISGTYFCHVKNGAKERHIFFDITIDDMQNILEKQKRRCALSGIELVFSVNGNNQTASLDRIDSNRGYTVDNIQWVHKDINKMKMDMDEATFKTWICKIFYHLSGELQDG